MTDADDPDLLAPADPVAGGPLAAEPAVRVIGWGLSTRAGAVFAGIDVELLPGQVLSVHGPAGSGRTMLLLTLCGRARATTGTGPGPDLRRRAALAATGGAVTLEDELTVAAHERERALLGPVPWSLDEAAAVLGLALRRETLVGELSRIDRTLTAVALAATGEPEILAADDVDAGLGAADRDRVAQALRALARSGPAVVVTSLDPLPGADVILGLPPRTATGSTASALVPALGPAADEPRASTPAAPDEPDDPQDQPEEQD